MFQLLIDREITALFTDNGMDTIQQENMIGFFINTEGIKELIDSIPVRKYYIGNVERKEITKEQAMMAYDEIIHYSEEVKTKR